MSLSSLLVKVSDVILSGSVKKMLTGAGVGLATFGITQAVYLMALNRLHESFAQMANFFFAINLSGLSVALSLIVSAIGIKVTLSSQKLAFKKAV